MPLYTSQYFGGVATISVATFANLPASGTTDERIAITGESALFNTTTYPAIVRWSGSAWELESCATTYLNVAAVEFASGTWTGTGGTIGTRNGATVLDTTYNESWVWNSTSNIFVPEYLNLTTVAHQKKIKGDSITLESGWDPPIIGPGCTLTTDGSKLTMYAQSASGLTYTSVVTFNDTGRTLTSNFYMKCLIARNNSTNFAMATSGQIQMYLQYLSGPSTGKAVEFGDADVTQGNPIDFTGVFFNRNSLTTYTAAANRGDVLTTETLLQFRVIAGTAAQVKVGNGAWHDIAVATCRSGAGTSFTIGTLSTNSGLNKAQCTLRYLQAIRYT